MYIFIKKNYLKKNDYTLKYISYQNLNNFLIPIEII